MGNRKFAACGWECQGCLLFWFVAHSRLPDLHTHTFTHTARHSQHVNKLLNTHDGVLRSFYSLLFGVKIPTFIAVSFAYCPRHVVSVDERKGTPDGARIPPWYGRQMLLILTNVGSSVPHSSLPLCPSHAKPCLLKSNCDLLGARQPRRLTAGNSFYCITIGGILPEGKKAIPTNKAI